MGRQPKAPALLTVAETAARLHVSPAHVYRMCRAGLLPAARVGRAWRVDGRRLDAALFDTADNESRCHCARDD